MKKIITESWAVALRDLRKKEKFLKYVGGLILVATAIFLIGLGFDAFIDFTEYGTTYTQFFSAGIIIFFVAQVALISGLEIIEDKKGFLKLLLISPISKHSILIGKLISGFLSSIKTFFLLVIIFLFLFNELSPSNIIYALIIILLVNLSFHSLGIWLSSTFKSKDFARAFGGYFSFAMLFFSGILYPIAALPEYIKIVFYLNPMTYIVELFRYIMGGEIFVPVQISITIFLIFVLITTFLGTHRFDKNMRK